MTKQDKFVGLDLQYQSKKSFLIKTALKGNLLKVLILQYLPKKKKLKT